MAKLLAAVNEELFMIQEAVLTESNEEMFNAYINKIAEAITNKVTQDSRFIEAVGKRNAKKAFFSVLPIGYTCDNCDTINYIMQISMNVGEEETDFYYGYCLINPGNSDELFFQPTVIYNNAGKSQLMKVFECCGNGVTSTKTFKNIHCDAEKEVTVEDIYEEILSEVDLRIF